MQTKKKVAGRSSARELSSPKVSRHQKKVSENVQIQEKKVAELITSSARKQKFATHPKDNGEHVTATNLNSRNGLVDDDTPTTRLGHDAKHAIKNASVDPKVCGDGTAHCKMETIFSPAFRIFRSVGGGIASVSVTFFQSGDQQFEDCGKENLQVDTLSSHGMQEKNNSNKDSFNDFNES